MPEQRSGNRFFWTIALLSYVIVVAATYARIYVYQDYPIFYSEEEMPDMAGEIITAITELGL